MQLRQAGDGVLVPEVPYTARKGDCMRPVRLALFVIAVVVCAQPAFAERGITPYYGYNYGGDSSNCVSLRDCKERHGNFGVSVGSVGGPGTGG